MPVGHLTGEVDVFRGALDGLWLVEVAFADRAAADAFNAPTGFGDEVTGRSEWGNLALATHGRPFART